MEEWQREHIVTSKPSLMQNITCSILLVDIIRSEKTISLADSEAILATPGGNLNQVSVLLNLLISRTDGYHALIRALQATNQDGAVNILLRHPNASSLTSTSSFSRSNSCQSAGAFSSNLLVGDKDCSVNKIVLEIEKAPGGAHFMMNNWKSLARRLDISYYDKEELSTDLQSQRRTHHEVLEKMLHIWINQMSDQATLQNLIDHIKDCGATNIADKLQTKFLR